MSLSDLLVPLIVILAVPVQAAPVEIAEADALIEEGRTDEAAALLKAAAARLRGDDLVAARFAWAMVDTDPVNAAAQLKSVATLSPARRAEALVAEAELLLSSGEADAALLPLKEAVALDAGPFSARASYLRGVALLAAGKPTEAKQAFADYLIDFLEGTFQPSARVGIAVANERLGRTREAVEIYKAVLAQHRGFEDEVWILERLVRLLRAEQPAEAKRYEDLLAQGYPERDPYLEPSVETPSVARPSTPAPAPVQPRPSTPAIAQDTRPQPSPVREAPAAPRPTPARSTPASNVRDTVYTFQCGVFSSRANAENLMQRLKSQGFSAEIQPRGPLFVVTAGRYSSRERAMEQVSRIQSITRETPRILER